MSEEPLINGWFHLLGDRKDRLKKIWLNSEDFTRSGSLWSCLKTKNWTYWRQNWMDAVLFDVYWLGLRCVCSYPNKIQLLAVHQQTTKWIMHPVQYRADPCFIQCSPSVWAAHWSCPVLFDASLLLSILIYSYLVLTYNYTTFGRTLSVPDGVEHIKGPQVSCILMILCWTPASA